MNIIEMAKQAEFSDREIQIAHDNFARFAAIGDGYVICAPKQKEQT
jgi:hypothetical protein